MWRIKFNFNTYLCKERQMACYSCAETIFASEHINRMRTEANSLDAILEKRTFSSVQVVALQDVYAYIICRRRIQHIFVHTYVGDVQYAYDVCLAVRVYVTRTFTNTVLRRQPSAVIGQWRLEACMPVYTSNRQPLRLTFVFGLSVYILRV